MKSVRYLEELKTKAGLKNDRQLAEFLDMTTGTMSQYMNGKRVMDDEACLKVAMALEIDPIKVVGAACIDRAEKAGQPSLWTVFMERAAATAAIAVLATGVNLFLTPSDANARTYSPSAESSGSCVYIM